MDFKNMKRKELQALCKEHGIPANLTNLEMANRLSSLLKVNDEKPLTRGRSCLKILDDNVNDRESDVVIRKVKKVKFSPDNEIIEFTRSAQLKRGGRRKSMLYKNDLNDRSDGLKVGILDSAVSVTRSQRMNMEDGVTEKKGGKRHVKDSVISVNERKEEVGVSTRSLRKKGVVVQEKREENEGMNDGLRMSRRVRSRKNAKESAEDSEEELKMDELNNSTSEKETDRVEKRDKKVTFISGGQMNECTKSETKAKEPKRDMRRKLMAHNQTLHVQDEVDAEVREKVAEKPARLTRSHNLKPVEDNVSNKRNRTRGKEAIETSKELLCTEFVESFVEAVKDEVRVNTRRSQQNNVVEAPQEVLKRSERVANKTKGARLTDDISKDKIVKRGRTRKQTNLTTEASTSVSGTKIVEPKGKLEVVLQLEEPVEVSLRRSDRRKSVFPLEKLKGDEVAANKEKRNFLNDNDDEPRSKGTKEEPQKALKQSRGLATHVEDSVLVKDDIAENEVVGRGRAARKLPSLETSFKTDRPTESQRTLEVVFQTVDVPVRSYRRKSVVPSLEKVRSGEVAVVKEKRNLIANDDEIRSKGTKEEPQKASKRSKRLAKQMEDPVLAQGDIAENKIEERRCSRRNAAKANVDTKILDRPVQEESSMVKEERRCTGRSAARHTLAAVSDDKKERGENKLTKRNCTSIQEKGSTNKFTVQDLDSLNQSMSSSTASDEAVVKKTSTAGKKQQGRLKRSDVEVEVPMPEDMEIVREPVNKDCNISGSAGTMGFSRLSLNELEAVSDDVIILVAGTKDDPAAKSSSLADKLNEERPLVDANASPSENNSAMKCLPSNDPFNFDAGPEENLVEKLLKSDHKAPSSKGLCPSSLLADDPLHDDVTSDKQEHSAIAADNAEEFDTGLSNEVLDNCSLSQSDNMEENLDFGTKDEAAAELSTLVDKLNEEGPLVDANASLSENNSSTKYLPFSDSFNSNARPKENLVEELLRSDHEAPASKDQCPSSVSADDTVPNEITSDEQEHGSTVADNAEEFVTGLSNEVLDNCSLSQIDNIEENLDSGFKELSEAGCVVSEGVTYGEQEPTSKGLCPSSALADGTVPNDITSDKQEHGAVAADNVEEFDTGLSNEVLDNYSVKHSDNMEENLDAGFKEQLETGCIVIEGVTYGEQEPESKGLCPSSVLADDAVPNAITYHKLEHGAVAADNGEDFDIGSSNEVLDNCSVNQSDIMDEKLDSRLKEHPESQCIVAAGVNYGEQETTVTDYAKECDGGLSSNVSLDNVGAFNQSNEMDVKNSESGPTEQAEAESGPVEAKYDLDAPTFSSQGEQGEIHAEEYANLEAATSEKTVLSPIKAVLDLQVAEPGILGDGITLHVTSPSKDGDEEKQGEELKILFATPGYVSHSKEEKKASLDDDSKNEGLNREGQVSPISGNDTSSLQGSGRDCGEHGQGEYLKNLFATPFGSRSIKVEIATCITVNETSSQYKSSCHENENTASSAGNGLAQSVTPLKDTSEDEAGEELKGLFATPCVVSQSVGGQHYLFQSQVSGDAVTTVEGLGSSGKENLSESVGGLIEDKQVENTRTLRASPVSVKWTNQETTYTNGKYSQSLEMETYICSGVERNLGESEAESVGVDQAPETSHITAFNFGDENEQEDHSKILFDSPIITQSPDQMDGTSRKMDEKKNVLSGNDQGLSHYKVFPVAHSSAMDLEEPDNVDSKHSEEQIKVEKIKETAECVEESSAPEEENNEGQGNMLSAASAKSMSPLRNDECFSQECKIKETAECMKESSALEEENNEGQGNMLSGTSAKSMSPLWNDECFSQERKIKETAECMKESSALEEENNEGQGNMLSGTSAKNMTPLRNDDFSSQEPELADLAMSGEMIRDTEMSTKRESCIQDIVYIEEHKIEETVADRDMLRRDTSRGLEEDSYVGVANESTSPVISEPTHDDIEFPEQQIMPEINKSSLENVQTSDAFNEGTEDHLKRLFATPVKGASPSCFESLKPSDAFNEEDTEDHLKLLFATPVKGTSASRLGEASTCQLKTAMIAMASEMVGKEPKHKGFEFSGEPLTVEIINGGSESTKRYCFSKEIEQFEGGPLFPTPSKGTSPLQLEESPGCEEDIFKDLDGVKFLNSQEQNFAQHEDRQLLDEMTDDSGEATLHWFQTNDGSVPRQTELEAKKENDSAHLFEPLHEEGEATEYDALAEDKEDDLVAYQESLEDRLINTDEAAKGGAASDAVCTQPNILLTDIGTEDITQESIRKIDGISISTESGILEFDAESTALRSQDTVINTVEETKGDEVQKIEMRNSSDSFLQNNPSDDEYAKEISTVLPADEQFHFEHYVIENVSSTEKFSASTNECHHFPKEDDLAAEGDRLVIFESNESTSMNVNDSALSEEPQTESDQGKYTAAKQHDEDSSTEAVLSPSSKSRENISFIEEGFAGEDTLMSEKKNDLAEKKVPLTPAGVAKTSFAKHLNSTMKKKNARNILIHGTPNKLTQIADMKENAPSVKGDIGTLTALRPEKRLALKDLTWK